MEDLIQATRPLEATKPRRQWRLVTVLAAVALVMGGITLARSADSGVTADHPAIAHDATVPLDSLGSTLGETLGFGAALAPQINIQAIVCPILAALASGPFAAFIGPVINALRIAFGCISG
ncbi:MAG: hypothetical protein AB1673_10985 [Actinomycetota bacterium]